MVELERRRLHQVRRALFEDYRRRNVITWLAPRGASMRPLIGANTWMLVEFGAAAVAVGDIALFPLGDMLVAHRIVAYRLRQGQLSLIPKGDAEPFYDAPIQHGEVIGVVRALREGRNGLASGFGCTGRASRALAFISRMHGSGAWLARSAAAVLPNPLWRPALRAIPPFARVVARVLFAPVPWAAWFAIKTA